MLSRATAGNRCPLIRNPTVRSIIGGCGAGHQAACFKTNETRRASLPLTSLTPGRLGKDYPQPLPEQHTAAVCSLRHPFPQGGKDCCASAQTRVCINFICPNCG